MKEIQDFFKNYKRAVWEKDPESLIDLYHSKSIQFDTWNRGYHPDTAAWRPEIVKWLSSLGTDRVQVDFEILQSFTGKDIAFASGLIKFAAIAPNGELLRSMKNRITVGFVKEKDQWKAIHQHISAPVSSKDLSAILSI